jgi:hypothetical protein
VSEGEDSEKFVANLRGVQERKRAADGKGGDWPRLPSRLEGQSNALEGLQPRRAVFGTPHDASLA